MEVWLPRDAVAADAARCAAVYAPYVTDTVVSFELEPPTTADMATRIAAARRTHAWVVVEDAGRVVGYAYAGPYKARPAYRWACEVSVYLAADSRRAGGGRALYAALFERLANRGFRTAIAGMVLPNEPSERLHRAMGFERIGTFRRVGWKHGRWHDVAYAQRPIGDDEGPPAELR